MTLSCSLFWSREPLAQQTSRVLGPCLRPQLPAPGAAPGAAGPAGGASGPKMLRRGRPLCVRATVCAFVLLALPCARVCTCVRVRLCRVCV